MISRIPQKSCQKCKQFVRNFTKCNHKAYERDQGECSVVNKHAPIMVKKVRGRKCPWLISEIQRAMVERDYYLRKARGTGREVYWSMYTRPRNDVTKKIRHSKTAYARSIVKDHISHPKQFWNQIEKSFRVKQPKEVPSDVFTINGNSTTDKQEIANGFCRFFAEISKRIKASVFSISAISSIWKHHNNACVTEKLNPARSCFIFQRTSPRDF